jgi:hypothetical protein
MTRLSGRAMTLWVLAPRSQEVGKALELPKTRLLDITLVRR